MRLGLKQIAGSVIVAAATGAAMIGGLIAYSAYEVINEMDRRGVKR